VSLGRTGWSRPAPSRGVSVGEVRALPLAPSAQPIERNRQFWSDSAQFDLWRIGLRRKVLTQAGHYAVPNAVQRYRCAASTNFWLLMAYSRWSSGCPIR
jgi:hypothetical protein